MKTYVKVDPRATTCNPYIDKEKVYVCRDVSSLKPSIGGRCIIRSPDYIDDQVGDGDAHIDGIHRFIFCTKEGILLTRDQGMVVIEKEEDPIRKQALTEDILCVNLPYNEWNEEKEVAVIKDVLPSDNNTYYVTHHGVIVSNSAVLNKSYVKHTRLVGTAIGAKVHIKEGVLEGDYIIKGLISLYSMVLLENATVSDSSVVLTYEDMCSLCEIVGDNNA